MHTHSCKYSTFLKVRRKNTKVVLLTELTDEEKQNVFHFHCFSPSKFDCAGVSADENRETLLEEDVQLITIDSVFTPIRNVRYDVENYRIEQKTDYEKLNLEIVTDGSIHPKDALKEAAKILIHHFMLFSDDKFCPLAAKIGFFKM